MSVAVGAVHVDVVPSTREFVKDMSRDLLKDADKLGKQVGRDVGSNVAREVGKRVSDGIEKGVSDANTSGEAAKEGKKAGGAFARAAEAEITKALESLPDVNLNGDVSGVMQDIALVRQALSDLRDKDIGVGISGADALTEIRKLQAYLDSLRNQDVNVDVQFNIDQASKALTKLQKKIADDSAGSFDKGLRSGLESALKNLPDLQINANASAAQATLAEIRADLATFSDATNIDVNIDANAALNAVDQIVARLKALVADETIELKVRTDAAATIAQLTSVGASARELRDAFAGVEDEVGQVERAIGGFAAFVRSTVAAALNNLPDFDVNTTPAEQALARVRGELAAFENLTIGVDLNARDALAGIDGLLAELRVIEASDTTLDVKINARDAIAGLESVRVKAGLVSKQVSADLERSLGAFGTKLKSELESAARDLPQFEIRANTDPVLREVETVRQKVAALAARITVEGDTDAVMRDLSAVIMEAELINTMQVDLKVRSDVSTLIANLTEARNKALGLGDSMTNEFEKSLGRFGQNLHDTIAKAAANLPTFEVDANTDPALREVDNLRNRIASLAANIRVTGDTAGVQAKLQELLVLARTLDATDVDVSIKSDIKGTVDDLLAAQRAAQGLGPPFEQAASKLDRMRLIMGLIVAALPLMAGALLGISAAVTLLAAPIAAVVVGMDGIKKAAAEIAPAFVVLKQQVSDTFERGMRPAMQNIVALVPALTTGLKGTATSLSAVATEVSRVATSGNNLKALEKAFDGVNKVIVDLGPALATFVQNFVNLTSIGAASMGKFGAQLNSVAVAFGDMVARLNETGTAQAAIAAIFSIISELVGLIGPITELGAVILAAIGPALAGALSLVGTALSTVAQILDSLPAPIQGVVTALLAVRLGMLLFGATGPTMAAAINAVKLAFTGLGVSMINVGEQMATTRTAFASSGAVSAFGVALGGVARGFKAITLALVGNPLTLAILAITAGLALLAGANDAAAAAEANHKQYVEDLSSALQASGGAIDANVLAIGKKALVTAEINDDLVKLGKNESAVALAIAQGGPAYDAMVTSLENVAKQRKSYVGQGGMMITVQTAEAKAAQAILDALPGLRDGYISAAEANKAWRDSLETTGASLQGGLANAKALQENLGALGNEATQTSAKITALKSAMDELNGGALTAEQATQKLNDKIRALKDGLGEVTGGSQKVAASLVDATGQINTTTEAGSKLFTAVTGIRDSMLESAVAAFDAKGGLTNVGAASAAAAQEVQRSRDAFIKAAEGAGFTAAAAADLANHYGLIPKLVTTLIQGKNIPEVTRDISTLAAQVTGLPKGTQVEVTALTDQAKAAIDAVGIKITQIPGVNGEPAKSVVTVDDQTAPALAGILQAIMSSQGFIPTDLNTNPANAKLAAQIASIDSSHGTMTLDGDPTLANGKITAAVKFADGSKGTIVMDANPDPATGKINATVTYGNGQTARITVTALDNASKTIDYIARNRTAVVTIIAEGANTPRSVRGTQSPNLSAQGAIYTTWNDGGIAAFAKGGYGSYQGHKLTPMAAGVARVVAPNSWRVVGDRLTDDEAYIPINKSGRSKSILTVAADRMGYQLMPKGAAPMADGGLLGSAAAVLRLAEQLQGSTRARTQQSSSFLAGGGAGAAGTVLGTAKGGVKTLEQKLDTIAGILAANPRGPASITVEDRSGNPVETARATQLALRLSR